MSGDVFYVPKRNTPRTISGIKEREARLFQERRIVSV
jgi:hypothetical protein